MTDSPLFGSRRRLWVVRIVAVVLTASFWPAKAEPPFIIGGGEMGAGLRWQMLPPYSLELHAFNEVLCGMRLLVNDAGPEVSSAQPRPEASLQSNDWRYLEFDLTSTFKGCVTRYRRHVLCIEPDVFVVYDDLQAFDPAQFRWMMESTGLLVCDAKSGNVTVERPQSGFTAHTYSSPAGVLGAWQLATNSHQAEASPIHGLKVGTTNRLAALKLLTVFVPHATGKQRALGFRFIESDSAIGLRIYRDGLPTLVAFHTGAPGTEADFTGLKFSGPVAVDVFNPKPKRR